MAQATATEKVRLNLGSGNMPMVGYFNIDLVAGIDARELDAFDNGSVGEIRASHLLQHMTMDEAKKALVRWHELLEDGGELTVAVPDLQKKIVPMLCSKDPALQTKAINWIYGNHGGTYDMHLSGYTWETLCSLLAECGYGDFEAWLSEIPDQASYPVSLNVKCVKGGDPSFGEQPEKEDLRIVRLPNAYEIPETPSVCAVLSKPRLTVTDHEACWTDTVMRMGIKRTITCNGFPWEAALENGIEKALNEFDDPYMLFTDFDSVMDPGDLQVLVDTMQAHPELTALYPCQAHRHKDELLCDGNGKYDVDSDVTETSYGHFGLTLIRTDALRRMMLAKPWFWSMPNATTNRWEDGKTDADIFFWRRIQEFGGRIGRCNKVVIGHMEWGVKWPKNMGTRFDHDGDERPNIGTGWQTIQSYRNNGKPDWAGVQPRG